MIDPAGKFFLRYLGPVDVQAAKPKQKPLPPVKGAGRVISASGSNKSKLQLDIVQSKCESAQLCRQKRGF
jgi:hypothetical protein